MLSTWRRSSRDDNICAGKKKIQRVVDTEAHVVCQACVDPRGADKTLVLLHTSSSMLFEVVIIWEE